MSDYDDLVEYVGPWLPLPDGVTYDPMSLIIVCSRCNQHIDMYAAKFQDNLIVHTCTKP